MKLDNKFISIVVFISLFFMISLHLNSQKEDEEFNSLLKNLEHMIDSYEKDVQKPPTIKKTPQINSTRFVQEKRFSSAPALIKKDMRTNFIESFELSKALNKKEEKSIDKKETITLPSFKQEALEGYLSNFLLSLISLRKKIASTDIYRRTKTFSTYNAQLNEIEILLWEILNNSVYSLSFFTPQ